MTEQWDENDYQYHNPEADELVAKMLQRLALAMLQSHINPETKPEQFTYFGLDEDSDLDDLLKNAQ